MVAGLSSNEAVRAFRTSEIMEAGDLVFVHSNKLIGRVIQLGERLRWNKLDARYNHVAIIDRVEGDKAFVIQAEAKGVTNDKELTTLSADGSFIVVPLPAACDRQKVLAFARAQVGSKYGWLSIASVALDILTPSFFPLFRRNNSWICSAVAAESLRFGGWFYSWPDVYTVTPAQLFASLN
jgi:hypothetical protein